MQNKKNSLQRNVGRCQDIHLSGYVPQILQEPPISKCLQLSEARVNLDNIAEVTKKVLQNINSLKHGTFRIFKNTIDTIRILLKLRKGGDGSWYSSYQSNNGILINFRFAFHDCNGDNFDNKNEEQTLNISVFVSYTYLSFRGRSTTSYQEYEITPGVYEENPKGVINAIAIAVENAINTGVFSIDSNVAKPIDTKSVDTIDNIVNRYQQINGRRIVYTFSKNTFQYVINNALFVSDTEIKLSVTSEHTGNEAVILISNENNKFKTYLLLNNKRQLIKPDDSVFEQWMEFANCLFKCSNSNTIKESKQHKNMKKTITESQLRDIIAESIKQCLSEVGYGYHGQIEGYNGDPEGAEQWAKKHNFIPDEPHDDAWYRRYTQQLKDKGVIFEGDYDDIFSSKEAFDNFLKHDVVNSPQWKAYDRKITSPQFKELARKQFEIETLGSQKYFTPEQAKMLGYVCGDYQDDKQPYEEWVRKDGSNGCIKVERPKRNPGISPSGYSWNGKPLEESYLRNIVAESIRKVVNEIGDTQRGQYALGAVCARAKKRGEEYKQGSNNAYTNAIDTGHRERLLKGKAGGARTKMDNAFDKGYDDNLKESSLNEIGDTDKGQYALGQLAARQASKGDAWGLVHTNEHAWEQHRTRSKKYPNMGVQSDAFEKGVKDYQNKK